MKGGIEKKEDEDEDEEEKRKCTIGTTRAKSTMRAWEIEQYESQTVRLISYASEFMRTQENNFATDGL